MTPRKQKSSSAQAEPKTQPIPAEYEAAASLELEALKAELETARQKADENLDGWQRSMAEFSNYRRRVERDQTQSAQAATANAVRRYLDVADDLERALRNRPQEGEGARWAEGIELVYRKLLAAFEADGLEMIQAEGQPFDPNCHEGISQEDSPEHASGEIIGVVQAGYRIGERVVRPVRVRVAR